MDLPIDVSTNVDNLPQEIRDFYNEEELSEKQLSVLKLMYNAVIKNHQRLLLEEMYLTSQDFEEIFKQLNRLNVVSKLKDGLSLWEIELTNNSLSKIPFEFRYCLNLNRIQLNNNIITDMTNLCFISQIQHINLANNQLRYIPPEIKQLKLLKHLNLSNNLLGINKHIDQVGNIFTIENEQANLSHIYTLQSLISLDISNNGLSTISENLAYKLPNLIRLDLSSNALKTVPNNLGTGYRSIKYSSKFNLIKFKLNQNNSNNKKKDKNKIKNNEEEEEEEENIMTFNDKKNFELYNVNNLKEIKYLNLSSNLLETLPLNFCVPFEYVKLENNPWKDVYDIKFKKEKHNPLSLKEIMLRKIFKEYNRSTLLFDEPQSNFYVPEDIIDLLENINICPVCYNIYFLEYYKCSTALYDEESLMKIPVEIKVCSQKCVVQAKSHI